MENEIQPSILPVQPSPKNPPVVPTLPPTNWLKILSFTILGLIIVTGSIFFGIQIGKNQTPSQQPIGVQPTASPTQIVINPTALPTGNPTINPTGNWKTYINTKYNYSLQYPLDTGLTFLDCSNIRILPRDGFILVQKENTGCEGRGEGWIIYSQKYSGEIPCNSSESWKSISTPIIINNINANKCVSTFIGEQLYPGPTERINVTFSNNGTWIGLSLDDLKYSQLFDQILSTFKFIN